MEERGEERGGERGEERRAKRKERREKRERSKERGTERERRKERGGERERRKERGGERERRKERGGERGERDDPGPKSSLVGCYYHCMYVTRVCIWVHGSYLVTFRITKVSIVTVIGGGRRREAQNCRHFWGSWSRSPELSSLLASSRFVASQKCQQSQGSGPGGIRGGRGREAQNCRHFWIRLGSSRLKSVNSHRDRGPGGSWSRNPELSSLFGLVGLASGERRGERIEEKREEGGEERGDKR